MPIRTRVICETVSAVFAITTEASPSEPETPKARRRCAFTGSPPTATVRLFTASPAMRVR